MTRRPPTTGGWLSAMSRPWQVAYFASAALGAVSGLVFSWHPGEALGVGGLLTMFLGRRWPGWLVAATVTPLVALIATRDRDLGMLFAVALGVWVVAAIVRFFLRDIPSLSRPLIPTTPAPKTEPESDRLADIFE